MKGVRALVVLPWTTSCNEEFEPAFMGFSCAKLSASQQIPFGDYAYDRSARDNNRNAADAMLNHRPGDLLDRGFGGRGDYAVRHNLGYLHRTFSDWPKIGPGSPSQLILINAHTLNPAFLL
jgi:hypothetical protein